MEHKMSRLASPKGVRAIIEECKELVPAVRTLRGHLKKGHQPIYLDYPVEPSTRYGWGRPTHAGIGRIFEAGRDAYVRRIESMRAHSDGLRRIASHGSRAELDPYWMNGWVQGLDAASLYSFPIDFGSRLYVEVGSGNSTKFVRRSVRDHGLPMRMISIDPEPRADIDQICDEVLREPLETVDLGVFDRLKKNDILVIDGSHRCFQNSDVTAVFLDVLPRLASGVVVYIDDIYLPSDYPPAWKDRYYSEQYLLAVLLLADAGRRYEVLLPGYFCTIDPESKAIGDAFWNDLGLPEMTAVDSNGIWLQVR